MDNFIPVINDSGSQIPSSRKEFRLWPIIVLIFVFVLGGSFFLLKDRLDILGANVSGTLPTSGYQAVFLSSGQVYFGKLEQGQGWLVLKDVYYLQVEQNIQQGLQQGQLPSNFQLVKLGSEIHGPEDVMYIDSKNILFWENLKSDSQVMQAIERYRQNKN